MKAFIAVALLAACVAAQTIVDQPQTTTGLFNNPTLLKNIRNQQNLGNFYNQFLGQQYQTNQQYGLKGYNVQYSLEELVRHPLFAQYYAIPLFRQHFNHPLFQVYLTTPYFQQYWTYPEFQTFFRNPYLFYKYVYPVVFSVNTNEIYDQSIYNNNNQWNRNAYPWLNGQYDQQQQVIRPFDWTVGYQPRNNWWNRVQQQTVVSPFNTAYPTQQVNHAYVLDKVFRNTFLNKPHEITEVKTDVKILKPTNQIDEQNFGRYQVDPITGEIKNVQGPIEDLTKTDILDKDAILKKIYLNKALYENKNLVNDVYPTVLPQDWTNKYETVKNLDEKVKEQLNNNNFEQVLPTLSRTRRHTVYNTNTKPATYTPYTSYNYNTNTKPVSYTYTPYTYTYNTHHQQHQQVYNKNARSLYYVPLTYQTPVSYYTVPTTYTHQTYQPTWYYPAQTIVA